MDLVDVVRAVAKRWWLVLAVLGTGAVLAVLVAGRVQPTYEVRADTLFVGPADYGSEAAPPPTTAAIDEGSPDNPYLRFSGSLEVTSEAVARQVDGSEFRSQLGDEGYLGTFELEGASNAPLLTVVAEADDPDAAGALADRVVTGMEDALADLQDQAGVPRTDQIVTRTLTTSDAEQLAGSRNRVLVSILVLAGVLAVGAAVFLESMETRRRLRDLEGRPPEADEPRPTGEPAPADHLVVADDPVPLRDDRLAVPPAEHEPAGVTGWRDPVD